MSEFEILTTLDVAADSSSINGNEFRDILLNEIKNMQRIGDLEFDIRDFSVTNIEGKGLGSLNYFFNSCSQNHSSAFVLFNLFLNFLLFLL